MKNSNLKFAYSTSTVTNQYSTNQAVTLAEMVSIIKDTVPSSSYKSIADTTITGLNEGRDVKEIKKEIAPMKMGLPFFLFSGFQANGHNNKGIEYNGCVQIDIDFKEAYGHEMALDAKESLSKLPFILFAGISPSGVGVKALVRTSNLNKDIHVEVLNQVIDNISSTTNINKNYFDSVGASQPVFAFYDSQLFVNLNADTFEFVATLPKKLSTINVKNTAKKCLQSTATNKAIALTDSKLEKALKIAYNSATNRRGNTVDTTFLQSYVGTAISFGVEAKDALDYLHTQGHVSDMNEKRTTSFVDMYRRYNASFGTAEIAYNIETPVYTKENSLHLSNTQMLSDLDLDLTNNSIIQSPTGSGKSYYVGTKLTMKRVMVVPTQSLVKQFAQEYNASPFYADAKELTNTNFIVTTYKSFTNLCNLINTKDYTLFIDEAHNTTSSASHTFLLKELNEVVDLVGNFKNYHLLTATPLFNFHPSLNDLELITVTKNLSTVKTLNQLRYTDIYQTLQDNVAASVKNDAQFVILSNNTDEAGRLGRIQAALSNFNVATINSTKKDEDSFIEIAIDGDMTNCQGIIATTVIKEGNSITKHASVINVFIDGNFHPAELEQFTARFRNATEINLFLLKPETSVDSFCSFSLSKSANDIEALATLHDGLRVTMQKSSTIGREQLNLMNSLCKYYFRQLNDEMVYDYLSMSNLVFEEEKKAANKDYDYMAEYLNRFGWNDKGILTDASEMNQADKETMKVVITLAKDAKQVLIDNILDTVKDESVMTNEATLEENKITCKVEKDIRYKLNVISKYTDTIKLTPAITILNTIGLSTQAWTSFTKALNIQKLKTNTTFITDKTNDLSNFINEVYNTFKVGAQYSSDTIHTVLTTILDNNFPSNELSKTKANQLLSTFFTITKKSVRVNDKVVHEFLLDNNNPTNLTINTDAFLHEVEYQTVDYSTIF